MPAPTFKRATRQQARLRMAVDGPAGSGKTYTALSMAAILAGDKPVALIDTERGSASKYSHIFQFDSLELESFHPQRYIEAIQAAADAGYGALIIDSLSHAWMGRDGALELVDRAAKSKPANNSYTAWRDVTPLQNDLLDAIMRAPVHVIATLRVKQDHVQEKDHNNKTVIRKVGLAPIQRDGVEYEFDVFGHLTMDNDLVIGKTRCPELTGEVISKPGEHLARTLLAWLGQGEPPPAQVTPLELHRIGLNEASDLKMLQVAWNLVLTDKALLSKQQLDTLNTLKEERKAALTPVPEPAA